MILEYKKKARRATFFIFFAPVLGLVLMYVIDKPWFVAFATLIILTVMLIFSIIACRNYAIGKGYHALFGFLGLMIPLGLIIVLLLPNRNKNRE